jgi:long-chain acyl-CoA synthetase
MAVIDEYCNIKLSYSGLVSEILRFSTGLQSLGLKQYDHVAVFSENSAKWLITDQSLFLSGAVNAVRGSQAPVDELDYIIGHSDSCAIVLENSALFQKLTPVLLKYSFKFIIILSDEKIEAEHNFPVYTFREVLDKGYGNNFDRPEINKNDTATIVYTSGTTGRPKGAMLTHDNLTSQVINVAEYIHPTAGNTVLNILPVWHMYERTCEYFLLSNGCTLVYTNLRNFKNDINKYNPNYMVGVPRLWEAVYEGIIQKIKKQGFLKYSLFKNLLNYTIAMKKLKRIINKTCIFHKQPSFIQKITAGAVYFAMLPLYKFADRLIFAKIRNGLGGKLLFGISGGGSLAGYLEDFYEAVSITIFVGYGLTETSPVVSARSMFNNKLYSAGNPLAETQVRIVDPETKAVLPNGKKGLVMVKGRQVMKGYYKDSEATGQIMDEYGWLNTGDLGWLTDENDIVLTGRYKDIIVLSNGENIEPSPIEEACLQSPYIRQIVLTGQDQSSLGAIIVPDLETFRPIISKLGIKNISSKILNENPEIQKIIRKELFDRVKSRHNYLPHERIAVFKFIDEEFTVENGMITNTAKIRRNKIFDRYKKLIEKMHKLDID